MARQRNAPVPELVVSRKANTGIADDPNVVADLAAIVGSAIGSGNDTPVVRPFGSSMLYSMVKFAEPLTNSTSSPSENGVTFRLRICHRLEPTPLVPTVTVVAML